MDRNPTIEPRHIRPGAFVRLTRPVPALALNEGNVGVVRAALPGPADAYEVEFHRPGQDVPARALLRGMQVEPQEGPLLTKARPGAFRW